MSAQTLFAEIMKLPPTERRDLVCDLLDTLRDEVDMVEEPLDLSPEFVAELDRISKDIEEHPELLVSFDEVEKQADAEFRNE